MRTLTVIGMGPGSQSCLTLEALEALKKADLIVGASRLLETLPEGCTKNRKTAVSAQAVCDTVHGSDSSFPCVVCTGDTGCYSLCTGLGNYWDGELSILPGIGSMSYFSARIHLAWQDWKVVSAHGRACDPVQAVSQNPEVFFLTGPDNPAQALCRQLTEAGFGACQAYVGEKLSYPDERIMSGTVQKIAEETFAPLSVLVVRRDEPLMDSVEPVGDTQDYPAACSAVTQVQDCAVTLSTWRQRATAHGAGLPDGWFIRGEVPMTKQEVRTVALAKLGAAGGKVLYDVGAGTGSVSVELALLAGQAQVYAIECEEDAAELIKQNRDRFGCENLNVILGKAPEALKELPAPDAAFIGGTKGNLPEILSVLFTKNPSVRVVVTAILLETALQACESLEVLTGKAAEVMQLQVSRSKKAGRSHMMCANNPIFLISGGGCADE